MTRLFCFYFCITGIPKFYSFIENIYFKIRKDRILQNYKCVWLQILYKDFADKFLFGIMFIIVL